MAQTDPNSQNKAASESAANAGTKHGVTATDSKGNFTGAGATSPKANDPMVNRDAVSPKIQNEKPETNVPRSTTETVAAPSLTSELGDREMAVVAPYDPAAGKDVTDNYNKAKEASLKEAPVATMGDKK